MVEADEVVLVTLVYTQEDRLELVPVAERDQTLPITTCTVEDTLARPCLPWMVTASVHRSVSQSERF